MSTFPGSPRLIKGGLVLLDVETSEIKHTIILQYNPQTLTRSLQIQGTGDAGGNRSEPLRLIGPPVETIKLDAEIDAADQLEFPDKNPHTVAFGIHPQLAALETLVYPSSTQIRHNNSLALAGTLEIIPMETLLTLFIWSKSRILPVRLTDFSVTEEAFDPALNPLQAKISLGLRVLNINDLGFDHPGGSLFMTYLQQKEQLAAKMKSGNLSGLGIGGIS
jgi:hypothetical protein